MQRAYLFFLKPYTLILLLLLKVTCGFSQTPLRGVVLDQSSHRPIAGASIYWAERTIGTSSDTSGFFILPLDSNFSHFTVSAIGYKPLRLEIQDKDSIVNVFLERVSNHIDEVSITRRGKYNRRNPATEIIDLVIRNKKLNKLTRKDSLFYKQYEKVKFGLVNPNKAFATKLGDMSFFFKNIDSTVLEGKGAVSLFMQEEVSNNYVKQSPSRHKKIIISEKKTEFDPRYINNHNIESYLNYIMQPIDLYDESIFFVNKLFLSPIADNAKTFYKYRIADTIRYADGFSIRILFEPFNKADLLFSGELIVSMDDRYAVEYAKMSVGKEANLSWVTSLQMNLSYSKNSDGIMLQDTSRVAVQFGGGKKDVLFGERIAVNYDYNLSEPISKEVFAGSPVEKSILTNVSLNQLRPIALNNSEQFTYFNVDRINQLSSFRTIAAVGYLLSQGYYNMGKFELGPLEYVYHKNSLEGNRIRLGGRSTPHFSEKVYLQGYLAYGFRDEAFKYYLRTAVSLNNKSVATFPAHYMEGIIQHDVFAPGRTIGYLKGDSFFRSFGGNRPNKWLNTNAYRLGYLIEFGNHVSIGTRLTHQRRSPLADLSFVSSGDSSFLFKNINTNDIEVKLRWAPYEKFYYRNLERSTIVEKYPVFTLQYNKGLKGFWGAAYDYDALRLTVSKRFFLNQLGFADITVSGGKIWGVLPYPLLEMPNVQEGDDKQTISYERTNTMEFVADKFVKFSYKQHFNGFFLNKIPLIKKLKLREIAGVKMFYGQLSDYNNPRYSNRVIEFDKDVNGVLSTYTLGKSPYWEGYVGLQNIFKLLEVRYYKRFNYLSYPNTGESGFWNNLRIGLKFDF